MLLWVRNFTDTLCIGVWEILTCFQFNESKFEQCLVHFWFCFFVSFLLSVEPLFTESLWDEYLTYYHGNEVVPIRKLTKCQLDSDYRSRWLGFLFVCWKSIKPIWVYFKKLLMVFMVCIYGSLWMAIDLIRLPYRSTGRLCMFWE